MRYRNIWSVIKENRQIEVWGVEPFASAAAIAADKLDRVITGPFGPETDLPAGAFDCIVFNDVLEHMVEPELALRYAKLLLSAGGTILASIPNVRYFPLLWQLGVRGNWEYGDCGLLDRTHLRFFTKSSILRMFQNEGYAVRVHFRHKSLCGDSECQSTSVVRLSSRECAVHGKIR